MGSSDRAGDGDFFLVTNIDVYAKELGTSPAHLLSAMAQVNQDTAGFPTEQRGEGEQGQNCPPAKSLPRRKV